MIEKNEIPKYGKCCSRGRQQCLLAMQVILKPNQLGNGYRTSLVQTVEERILTVDLECSHDGECYCLKIVEGGDSAVIIDDILLAYLIFCRLFVLLVIFFYFCNLVVCDHDFRTDSLGTSMWPNDRGICNFSNINDSRFLFC